MCRRLELQLPCLRQSRRNSSINACKIQNAHEGPNRKIWLSCDPLVVRCISACASLQPDPASSTQRKKRPGAGEWVSWRSGCCGLRGPFCETVCDATCSSFTCWFCMVCCSCCPQGAAGVLRAATLLLVLAAAVVALLVSWYHESICFQLEIVV